MLKCKSDDTKLSEPEKFKMQTLGAALPGRCDDEAIAYIAEHFGKRLQVAKTIEELSEASTELARALLAELVPPERLISRHWQRNWPTLKS